MQSTESSSSVKADHSTLIVLIALCFLELIAFGSALKSAGVYLDEWIYFQGLHFAGSSVINNITFLINDPRTIVRPIEAFHFGTLFTLVHEKPFLYHLVNQISEVAAAWFLYLGLTAVSNNRRLAFIAALVFLLYPSHDSTHYSIVASSISVSLAFFTLSCWQFVVGIQKNQTAKIWIAAGAYLLSVFNYELCLPLVVVYPMLAAVLRKTNSITIKRLLLMQLSFFAGCLAMVIYRVKILPALNLGWGYRSGFELSSFFHILGTGVCVSLSPQTFMTFAQMASAEWNESDALLQILKIIPVIVITTMTLRLLYFYDRKRSTEPNGFDNAPIMCIAFGLILLVAAYSIYACSPDYLPTLTTCINRVNAGGSIGAAIVIAGFFETIVEGLSLPFLGPLLVSIFAVFLTITNWQFAKPWLVSWQAQQQIQTIIRHNPTLFSADHAVILANVPRYVEWTPVYDGTWDFQSTCRILLNNKRISAGVLSPRMIVTKDSVTDKVGDIVCATYPLKEMIILDPSPQQWIHISSPEQFLAIAHKYHVDVVDRTNDSSVPKHN